MIVPPQAVMLTAHVGDSLRCLIAKSRQAGVTRPALHKGRPDGDGAVLGYCFWRDAVAANATSDQRAYRRATKTIKISHNTSTTTITAKIQRALHCSRYLTQNEKNKPHSRTFSDRLSDRLHSHCEWVAVRTNPARAIKIKFTHTLPRTNKKKIHRESKRRNRRKIHDRARSSTHFFFLVTTDRFCSFSHCLACRVTELLLSGFRGARGGATQSSTHTLRTPHVIPSRRRRQSSS